MEQRLPRTDFDLVVVELRNLRAEHEQKFTANEKDMDEFVETMQSELAQLKTSVLQSLNKKADFSMLDRLNELVAKKVDNEHLQSSQRTLKSEISQDMDLLRSEINMDRASREQRILERLEKCELGGERLQDEVTQTKELHRVMKDERKRDIEETADFIK